MVGMTGFEPNWSYFDIFHISNFLDISGFYRITPFYIFAIFYMF